MSRAGIVFGIVGTTQSASIRAQLHDAARRTVGTATSGGRKMAGENHRWGLCVDDFADSICSNHPPTTQTRMNFNQNSTWRGIIALVGAVAICIRPDEITVIVPAILAMIGTINVVRDQ